MTDQDQHERRRQIVRTFSWFRRLAPSPVGDLPRRDPLAHGTGQAPAKHRVSRLKGAKS
jgi:hypothetical protein